MEAVAPFFLFQLMWLGENEIQVHLQALWGWDPGWLQLL